MGIIGVSPSFSSLKVRARMVVDKTRHGKTRQREHVEYLRRHFGGVLFENTLICHSWEGKLLAM